MQAISDKLRYGVADGPLLDRDCIPAYLLTLFALFIGGSLFVGMGFRFDAKLSPGPEAWIPLGVIAAWLARRVGHTKIATGLETTALVYGQGFAFMLVIYSLMALPITLKDHWLAAADWALGFYWPSAAELFRRHAELTQWAKLPYTSFIWQPALVTMSLAAAGLHKRAWQFVTAATISLCITSVVGPLFPADTPIVHFGISIPELHAGRHSSFVIHALKNGRRLLDYSMLEGLVSIPSYHAVAACLFSWATYSVKPIRWPVLGLNAAMLAVVTVIGSHYLVDVIAGIGVAVLAIYLARKLIR